MSDGTLTTEEGGAIRQDLKEIAKRVMLNRFDWREVMMANEIGWRIEDRVIILSDWELEVLKKMTRL